MNSDFIEYDVFISNDLEEFEEENIIINKYDQEDVFYHKFHNPKFNLSTNNADLYNHIGNVYKNDIHKGCLYTSVISCILFDQKKYKNLNIIPKLSRKQKSYNVYLKKVRYSFNKLKVKNNTDNIHDLHIPYISNTIPEYLQKINDTYKRYNYAHIEMNINQIRLSLLYGYPIICGIKGKQISSVIVGFDKDKVKFLNTENNEYPVFYIQMDEVIQSIYDPCIIYSISGCNQEINLGFQR